jgi:peptidoglycan/LPS O-acetylase OafA/YrhL
MVLRDRLSPKRIPCLDGIRAVAIAMVIALHTCQRMTWPRANSLAMRILKGKGHEPMWGDGVEIFFVLSGFLISTQLLREFDKSGTIKLRSFYIRRGFRILPALYVYLTVAALFCMWQNIPAGTHPFLSSGLFYIDYFQGSNLWITAHNWSLSVEEQFYFLWPALLLFMLQRKGRAAAIKTAIFLILLAPVLRIAGVLSKIAYLQHRSASMFHTRIDALMCGCLAALLLGIPKYEAVYKQLARIWWVFPLFFLTVSRALDVVFGSLYFFSIGSTLESICVAFFIVWVSRNAGSLIGRVLDSRVLSFIGVLSYSLYLWQTLFINGENHTWLAWMPINFVLLAAAAWGSYTFIEQPSLALRDRHYKSNVVAAIPPALPGKGIEEFH